MISHFKGTDQFLTDGKLWCSIAECKERFFNLKGLKILSKDIFVKFVTLKMQNNVIFKPLLI